MVRRIEFVCTANNGKSPVALAVAVDYTKDKLGYDKLEYSLSSTGTMVDVIIKSDGPDLAKYLKQFCNDAYEGNIISREELGNLNDNPRSILEKFLMNERVNRDRYLKELGLKFADYPTQTHLVVNSGIIACIGDSNLERVKGLYKVSECAPKIVNLMGEDYPDIGNQWVLTYEEFKYIAEDIRKATISLIDSF